MKLKITLQASQNINYGGCGVAALALIKWMKDNPQFAIPYHLIYLFLRKGDEFHVQNAAFLRGQASADACHHVCFKTEGVYWDVKGEVE